MARKDLVILDVEDLSSYDDLVKSMSPGKFARKVSQASRRVIRETKTDASRKMREVWNIKKRDLDKGLSTHSSITRGYRVNFRVNELRISGRPINLREFDAVGVRRTARGVQADRKDRSTLQKRSKRQTGITALIKKGEGRTNLPSAFFATVRSGAGYSTRVFRRNSQNNLKSVNVITIASMFDQLGIRGPVIERALERYEEELKRIGYLDI